MTAAVPKMPFLHFAQGMKASLIILVVSVRNGR
jgi:hypothetical protein